MNRECINEQCGWEGDESLCLTFKNSDWARLCPLCHEVTEESEPVSSIVLTIPKAAVPHLLEMASPTAVCETFLVERRMPTIRLRTYGMWWTRIFDADTGDDVGHVVYWTNGRITISRVAGDVDELIYDYQSPSTYPPDSAECLAIWRMATGEQEEGEANG